MISELVVDVQPKEVSIAVLEDKNLVELQKEARNVSFAVGDIYLGKVKKLTRFERRLSSQEKKTAPKAHGQTNPADNSSTSHA